ncbi:hypothetical protein L6452_28284 [Arctium lappa]|uniref:Uncharacterized protein n=1 Tax=Arctium lappa TaxID=4217 RepID=A0ACB8ZZD4_ARCLA|nr:hypothetical protein L6452_28284 [Arctium lappa]
MVVSTVGMLGDLPQWGCSVVSAVEILPLFNYLPPTTISRSLGISLSLSTPEEKVRNTQNKHTLALISISLPHTFSLYTYMQMIYTYTVTFSL